MNPFRALAIAVAIASLGCAATATAEDAAPRVTAVANLLGGADADRARLAAGEVVVVRSVGRRWRESAAVLVPAPPAAVLRAMERDGFHHAGRRALATVVIPQGEIDASAFAALPIDGETAADEWNLSATEQALLRDVARDQSDRRELAAVVRHLLAERTAAYRSGGPRAIASYARSGTDPFPVGAEAAAMWAQNGELNALAPGLYAAVQAYPRSTSLDLQHSFLASVTQEDDRPTIVLSHRVQSISDEYAIAVEREFYVSRGYAVRQTVFGAEGISGGRSVAFYLNVTAGAAPTVGRAVGLDSRDLEARFAGLRDLTAVSH